jgi:pyruvate/2-oxoglutarate dehydrogenase complex dihydrolipoamide acyltransferase (E2) component
LADFRGGTFTVTNLGTHGKHRTFGTPIINHPQAAIMGVGRIRDVRLLGRFPILVDGAARGHRSGSVLTLWND